MIKTLNLAELKCKFRDRRAGPGWQKESRKRSCGKEVIIHRRSLEVNEWYSYRVSVTVTGEVVVRMAAESFLSLPLAIYWHFHYTKSLNTKLRWETRKPGITTYPWIVTNHEDIQQIFRQVIFMFLYLLSGFRFVLRKKNKLSCGFEIHFSVESWTTELWLGQNGKCHLWEACLPFWCSSCVWLRNSNRSLKVRAK